MILLKPFEAQALQAGAAGSGPGSSSTSVQYRMVVLRCLRELVSDGQLLVDLFVNYDCDLESSNLFERLVNGLVKLAQQPVTVSLNLRFSICGPGPWDKMLLCALLHHITLPSCCAYLLGLTFAISNLSGLVYCDGTRLFCLAQKLNVGQRDDHLQQEGCVGAASNVF